jgi:hypothetical protein
MKMGQLPVDFCTTGEIDDDGDNESDHGNSKPSFSFNKTRKNQVNCVENITGRRTQWDKAPWEKRGD